MYEELLRLPPAVLRSNASAVIVPSVFVANKKKILASCQSLMDCAARWGRRSCVRGRTDRFFPKTKESLKRCLQKQQCSLNKEGRDTHVVIRLIVSRIELCE